MSGSLRYMPDISVQQFGVVRPSDGGVRAGMQSIAAAGQVLDMATAGIVRENMRDAEAAGATSLIRDENGNLVPPDIRDEKALIGGEANRVFNQAARVAYIEAARTDAANFFLSTANKIENEREMIPDPADPTKKVPGPRKYQDRNAAFAEMTDAYINSTLNRLDDRTKAIMAPELAKLRGQYGTRLAEVQANEAIKGQIETLLTAFNRSARDLDMAERAGNGDESERLQRDLKRQADAIKVIGGTRIDGTKVDEMLQAALDNRQAIFVGREAMAIYSQGANTPGSQVQRFEKAMAWVNGLNLPAPVLKTVEADLNIRASRDAALANAQDTELMRAEMPLFARLMAEAEQSSDPRTTMFELSSRLQSQGGRLMMQQMAIAQGPRATPEQVQQIAELRSRMFAEVGAFPTAQSVTDAVREVVGNINSGWGAGAHQSMITEWAARQQANISALSGVANATRALQGYAVAGVTAGTNPDVLKQMDVLASGVTMPNGTRMPPSVSLTASTESIIGAQNMIRRFRGVPDALNAQIQHILSGGTRDAANFADQVRALSAIQNTAEQADAPFAWGNVSPTTQARMSDFVRRFGSQEFLGRFAQRNEQGEPTQDAQRARAELDSWTQTNRRVAALTNEQQSLVLAEATAEWSPVGRTTRNAATPEDKINAGAEKLLDDVAAIAANRVFTIGSGTAVKPTTRIGMALGYEFDHYKIGQIVLNPLDSAVEGLQRLAGLSGLSNADGSWQRFFQQITGEGETVRHSPPLRTQAANDLRALSLEMRDSKEAFHLLQSRYRSDPMIGVDRWSQYGTRAEINRYPIALLAGGEIEAATMLTSFLKKMEERGIKPPGFGNQAIPSSIARGDVFAQPMGVNEDGSGVRYRVGIRTNNNQLHVFEQTLNVPFGLKGEVDQARERGRNEAAEAQRLRAQSAPEGQRVDWLRRPTRHGPGVEAFNVWVGGANAASEVVARRTASEFIEAFTEDQPPNQARRVPR